MQQPTAANLLIINQNSVSKLRLHTLHFAQKMTDTCSNDPCMHFRTNVGEKVQNKLLSIYGREKV
jgi:hypothetical protein